MAKGDIHVVPADDEWLVRAEGLDRVLARHASQEAAIEAGRSAARAEECELVIHGRDGEIRERDSYGNDPRVRRG
jgi:Uncharacterized protein conserved in bacteria (DUF2188)